MAKEFFLQVFTSHKVTGFEQRPIRQVLNNIAYCIAFSMGNNNNNKTGTGVLHNIVTCCLVRDSNSWMLV
jgi:hypothetical protein